MLRIQQITSDGLQNTQIILPDGTSFDMTLCFIPMQRGWFIQNLNYLTFSVNNIRITNNADILYPWRNKLPFGLACFSKHGREPSLIEDFSSGNSRLYLLTQADVAAFTDFLENG